MDILLVGVATGCVYALVAAGYSLVYRTTGIVNFAQGSFVMVGGMTAYWMLQLVHLPYPLAIVGGIVCAIVTGLIFWTLVILPLWRVGAAGFVVTLSTLVFAALVQDVVQHWLGTFPQTLPEWIPGVRLQLGGAGITAQYVLVFVVAVILLALTAAFLRWSIFGKRMRACAASRDTSRLLGISPERTGALALAFTAGLGGLGGVLITPAQFTSFDAGNTYGIFGFVAAVLGGFGSLWGGLLGGALFGLLLALIGRYISTDYLTFIAFALLLVLLAVRPQGIFGQHWEES